MLKPKGLHYASYQGKQSMAVAFIHEILFLSVRSIISFKFSVKPQIFLLKTETIFSIIVWAPAPALNPGITNCLQS